MKKKKKRLIQAVEGGRALGVGPVEEVQMQKLCTMSIHSRGRGQAGCIEKEVAAHLLSTPTNSFSFSALPKESC